MATAEAPPKTTSRSSRPQVNLFDMPELLPGAQPSANPAQKEEFEQRCRHLHDVEVQEQTLAAKSASVLRANAARSTSAEMEAMFPMLDAALVRTLLAEAPNPQAAVDTLLALSASFAEPVAGGEEPPPAPPPLNLGVEDHEKFPSLLDSGGWQVVGKSPDQEELGSAWCDRAKAAKDVPAPRPAAAQLPGAASVRRKPKDRKAEEDADQQELPTDYDFRHRAGQRRAQHKLRYGRRVQGPAAAAAAENQEEEEEAGSDLES